MAKSFMENILPSVPTPSEKTVLGVKIGIRQRQEKRYNSDKLKHTGFLGVIYLPDGTHMTEQSISPKELENTPYAKKRGVEIPILVPANKKYLEDIASVEDVSTLPKSTYKEIKKMLLNTHIKEIELTNHLLLNQKKLHLRANNLYI